MPVAGLIEEIVRIPEGVRIELRGEEVLVSSSSESLSKVLSHPRIEILMEDNAVKVRCHFPNKKEKAMVGTFAAHIRNMIKGVTQGFEYKMKIVYSHFPMKATAKGEEFIIENFLGEKFPRKARILGKTKVNVKGEIVTLTGPSIEDVSQTAANIELATRIKGYDPRVFQDGIYIISKEKEA